MLDFSQNVKYVLAKAFYNLKGYGAYNINYKSDFGNKVRFFYSQIFGIRIKYWEVDSYPK